MKLKPFYTLPLALLLFVSLLHVACTSKTDKTSNANSEQKTENPTLANTANDSTPAAQDTSISGATNTENPPAPATGGIDDLPNRGDTDEDRMAVILDNISVELEAQKLAYVSELGQDCSGIYHKIKDMLQKKMSVLGDQSKYMYPSFAENRSSRQIADWYYRNGNLHIVQNPMADRNLIRPGSVMFYGRTEETYSNLTIDLLTNPGKFVHDGTKGKIMHIAVVTNVIKDANGNVTNYTIMHGRNTKYPASRTAGNHEGAGYERVFAKFPFGNWNQQWVAVARIETPRK